MWSGDLIRIKIKFIQLILILTEHKEIGQSPACHSTGPLIILWLLPGTADKLYSIMMPLEVSASCSYWQRAVQYYCMWTGRQTTKIMC
jgi:hypothetical protein